MNLPPLKYFFQPKRWKWVVISIMKKYLHKQGELTKPLTKVEQWEIARRVSNSQKCFYNGYCEKCKCDMVDVINTKNAECKHGCFPPAMQTDKELDEYLKHYNYKFGQQKITRK